MGKERVMIFVDHANVLKNLDKVDGRINYIKFKEILAQDSHLVGSFIYLGIPKKLSKEKRQFLSYLKKAKYIIQPKSVQILQISNLAKFRTFNTYSVYI